MWLRQTRVVVVVGTVAIAHMTWAPLRRKLTCTDSDEADERWLPGAVPYPPGLTQLQSLNSCRDNILSLTRGTRLQRRL